MRPEATVQAARAKYTRILCVALEMVPWVGLHLGAVAAAHREKQAPVTVHICLSRPLLLRTSHESCRPQPSFHHYQACSRLVAGLHTHQQHSPVCTQNLSKKTCPPPSQSL